LQKLTEIIRIELMISRFQKFFLRPNFQGGQMPVFPPSADAHAYGHESCVMTKR